MNSQLPVKSPAKRAKLQLATALLLAPSLFLGNSPLAHAQFVLSQSPPISYSQDPAPNVILSLDDSGSMGWDSPTRMSSLKNALRAQFGDGATSKGKIPDGSIRLAWQAMWDNGRTTRPSGQQNNQSTLVGGAVNSLKSFEGTHRVAFENFVKSMTPNNGTPSHKMMTNVRSYMGTATGINSPFASKPTVQESPILSCRRTYHVFMTDGEWNDSTGSGNIGNYDNGFVWNPSTSTQQAWTALPNGTTYTPTSDQVRVYRDTIGGNQGTLSDWAFANWATDFSTASNDATPLWRTTGDTQTITSTVTGASTVLQRFWNPKNNPMTWQGVTQHTIGFGSGATSWSGNPDWDDTTDDNYGGAFNRLVNGEVTWQNVMSTSSVRTSELWHMALNGRGKFYPARSPAALEAAFNDILGGILLESTKPLTGISANTSNLRTDSQAFVAGYDTLKWSGSFKAYKLSVTGALAGTPTWAAETKLDALTTAELDTRKIFTHTGTAAAPFVWASLSGSQQTALGGGDATLGANRVNYLRGDRSLEATGAMRSRASRLGDIVNSQPWYVYGKPRSGLPDAGYSAFASANASRAPMVYVGANDGMLHAFNANTGAEEFAYVPRGVYANLKDLTIPGYLHRYFVDGDAFTADVNFSGSGSDWRTVLVGTLGNGGKGYFLLDVTSPGSFGTSKVLADRTDGADNDIGHMVLPPVRNDGDRSLSDQFVRTNDNKWSLIMGNGVNSTNARPVLLVQALTSSGVGSAPTKVVAGTTGATDAGDGNGLSAPRLIDLNGDGKVDVAYAGDMKGNLWRFDLTSSTPSAWSAKKLYTAVDDTAKVQPIGVAPMWKPHPKGGLMVFFGTGRNFANGDATSTDVQTLYGIWDVSTRSTAAGELTLQDPVTFSGRTRLVEQEHVSTVDSKGVTYYKVSDKTVTYALSALSGTTLVADSTSHLGWYLDIPLSGHRVVNHPYTFDRNLVQIQTLLPSRSSSGGLDESCGSTKVLGDESLLYVIDILSGAPSKANIFNVSGEVGAMKLPSGHTTLDIAQGKDIILVDPVPPEIPSSCTAGAASCDCPVGLPCPCDKNGDGKCDKDDQNRLTRNWGPRIPSASYTEH